VNTIFLIRHAEKPAGDIQAVDENGTHDSEALTVRGWQRAGALAVFFSSKSGLLAPDRIYASAPGKTKVAPKLKFGSDSERPTTTVLPLAAKLHLDVIKKFTKGQEAGLAAEIAQQQGITLVCWQHEAIPAIAKGILGTSTGVPDPWPPDRFDVVWRFVRSGASGQWTFDQVCQNLLSGDQSSKIA
jgi:hypothetical protein